MKNPFKIFNREWVRIGDLGICCPICGKDDWCRVSKSGKYILCSRVPVYCQKGTLHKADKSIETKGITDKAGYYPPINWWALNKSYVKNCPMWRVKQFGVLKGITKKSLIRLGMGYNGESYTFPIYDENVMVGIQRQFSDGTKCMVKGSKLGIFVPNGFDYCRSVLVITEGVSDCATALDLGLNAVGRLNCSSGTEIIKCLANKYTFDSYIIVADNDVHNAGQSGAFNLGIKLKEKNKMVKVVIPPAEYGDLRVWKNKTGLTKEQFDNICGKLPVL